MSTYEPLGRLYGRTRAERIVELVEAADAIVGALQRLGRDPTATGFDHLATHLAGMERAARQLVGILAREVDV